VTEAEFREAVIAAYRDLTGVEPPDVLVKGDEKAGFTVTFSTSVFGHDAEAIVRDFRSAAMVMAVTERASVELSKALGEQATAEQLFRVQLQAAGTPEGSLS
jgi:hypothetical protein